MKPIKALYKIEEFKSIVKKVYAEEELSFDESVYLLGCAMLLIKEYDNSKNQEFFEMGYSMVLRYSFITNDFKPLYDISCNYGFYPTVSYINQKDMLGDYSLQNALLDYQMNDYRNGDYIETYEQNKTRKDIIRSEKDNIAFIAPTSSGKSSLIIQHLKNNDRIDKAVVLVPTKSLLFQTYIDLRTTIKDRKIISFEGMYKGEARFVGALTQERLLRLLEKNDYLSIDCLYVDEAHNIFGNDNRSIMLSRAITICKKRNTNLKVIFLSPFINDVNNLSVGTIESIEEQRIRFNIKEPNISLLESDCIERKYDRFSNDFVELGRYDNAIEYIRKKCHDKNFFFASTPRKIESLAEYLYENTNEIGDLDGINELSKLLAQKVHPDYKMIKYLSHGIIYLHLQHLRQEPNIFVEP